MVRGQQPQYSWVDTILAKPDCDIVQWLMSIDLLKSSMECHSCSRRMRLGKKIVRGRRSQAWQCRRCRTERSIRAGSIFAEAPRVPLKMFVKLMHLWALNIPAKVAGSCSRTTVRKVSKLCSQAVLHNVRTEPLLFERGTFNVDESAFCKRKYNRGRHIPTRWVFGIINMDHPTKALFTYVPSQDAATFQALIEQHIPHGSTIVSDGWRGYQGINQQNYQHLTVNHNQHFVDPNTGAHTNTIESAWRYAKEYTNPKRPRGVVQLQTLLYIYMWRQWRGIQWPGGCFVRLLNDISKYYILD